jgi:hypothetical protein
MVSKLKRPPTEWEKKSLLAVHQRTENQNIQGAQKTKLSQDQWTNKEVSSWMEQNFFKGRRPHDQKKKNTHEKLLTISGHKENANQKHTKIPLHSC